MDIILKGNNFELSDNLKEYATRKIKKLSKFFNNIIRCEVEFTSEKTKSTDSAKKVQVTLKVSGSILRCEESSVSFHSSVDIALEKIERQLKRYKNRLVERGRKGKERDLAISAKTASLRRESEQPSRINENRDRIVKIKKFNVKPMTADEALIHMDLLGHDFFLFYNSGTHNINAVYKRKDGLFGLLIPETDFAPIVGKAGV